MKIVFMGTAEFAVASLDAIYKEGHEIVAVVTAPDKPAGRGLQLKFSDVKQYALTRNLPILQPEKLKDTAFISTLKDLHADIFVVVAFRMLPEEVFTIPEMGTFNVHASLLPNYRGAAPIHWAVMNGESKTGVTTFFLNKEIDKGDIIDFEEVEIGANETTGELYKRLMQVGATLAVKTIDSIGKGVYMVTSQHEMENQNIRLAPKIFKQDTLIDWNNSAKEIFNKIRGLSPYPGAYTRIKTTDGNILDFKCFQVTVSDEKAIGKPGEFVTNGRSFIAVNASDFRIYLENVQLQGKYRMEICDFLRGFRSEKFILELF